jgi:hypothetical protein
VVDAQEGSSWGIGEFQKRLMIFSDYAGDLDAVLGAFGRVLEAGLNLVAFAAALFFFGGYALPTPHSHVGHFEEGSENTIFPVKAGFTHRAEVVTWLAKSTTAVAEPLRGFSPV